MIEDIRFDRWMFVCRCTWRRRQDVTNRRTTRRLFTTSPQANNNADWSMNYSESYRHYVLFWAAPTPWWAVTNSTSSGCGHHDTVEAAGSLMVPSSCDLKDWSRWTNLSTSWSVAEPTRTRVQLLFVCFCFFSFMDGYATWTSTFHEDDSSKVLD